ncbi:hypothetical protein F0562_028977 [Nyssa sinensis]|uniref:Uncharacterized protein n=1 Tax=Nyssa sinensis TaxID=561372 RepID=A0A5J5B1D7_9ASTE|nr:hypothetical protein F0562_028977 [Nyssa sinensis]
MTENQAQDEEKEATKKPVSASVPADSPSRKRLLANAKPKQGSIATSSDSALSSDSLSDRFRKKTRALPNFSECHSCGLRINNSNPKDKLQILDSLWRIVLLCKKCIKYVQSAELCSYCFSKTAENDCFRCPDCERQVHKDCIVKYSCFAPWLYCCSELGFSVCIDCWVPKLLANSEKVYKRSRKKKVVSKPCLVSDSRVLVNGGGYKSLEDVVKDANCVVEEKIAVAAKAKENAVRKAVVAKRAVGLANCALDLVAKKGGKGVKSESLASSSSASATMSMVVEDAELAFWLHRAMNSSPRISKNLCSINSSCMAFPNIWDCNGNLSVRMSGSRGSPSPSGCRKLAVCTNDHLKPGNTIYARFSTMDNECRENGEIGLDDRVDRCSVGHDNIMNSESQSCQKQDVLGHELHPNDTRMRCHLKYDGRSNGNPDRYLIKYSKRHDGRSNGNPDRYLIKYSKKHAGSKEISNPWTEFLYDSFPVESKAVAPGLPLNCSKESEAFSDASSNSCAVPMRVSACGHGSSQDHS